MANAALISLAQNQRDLVAAGAGLRFGLPTIDKVDSLMMPGQSYVVHGMTGEGKSMVAHGALRSACEQFKKSPLDKDGRIRMAAMVHTEEMTEILRAKHMLEKGLTPRALMDGVANIQQIQKAAIRTSGDPVIYIGQAAMAGKINPMDEGDFGGLTPRVIAGTIHDLLQANDPPLNPGIKIELVIIDHIHDLVIEKSAGMDNNNVMQQIDRELGMLIPWLGDAAWIFVCQDNLKDIVRGRTGVDRMPRKEDVQYLSHIVQRAKNVFGVWQPANGHVPIGEEIRFPTAFHDTRRIAVTNDLIFLQSQKARYSDHKVKMFWVPLTGYGASGVWGDLSEIDCSRLPQ